MQHQESAEKLHDLQVQNSHEISSHKINFHKINFTQDQLPWSQLSQDKLPWNQLPTKDWPCGSGVDLMGEHPYMFLARVSIYVRLYHWISCTSCSRYREILVPSEEAAQMSYNNNDNRTSVRCHYNYISKCFHTFDVIRWLPSAYNLQVTSSNTNLDLITIVSSVCLSTKRVTTQLLK